MHMIVEAREGNLTIIPQAPSTLIFFEIASLTGLELTNKCVTVRLKDLSVCPSSQARVNTLSLFFVKHGF